MRLYDILRSTDPSFPVCHVFVADEVAEALDRAEHDEDDFNYHADFYGTVAPPFEVFFIEAQTDYEGQLVERGVLVCDITHDADQQARLATVGVSLPEHHWVLMLYGFMRFDAGAVHVATGQAFVCIGRDGVITSDLTRITLVGYHEPPTDIPFIPAETIANFVPFAFRTIGLLHQKAEVEHIKPVRQERRKVERETGMTLHEHHIVHVGRSVQPPRGQRGAGATQRQTRTHAVRGHFRYYTEERPLFGRLSGMVWIPHHIRGAQSGAVTKTYEVHEE